MESNSLPAQHSRVFKLIRFIKNKPKLEFIEGEIKNEPTITKPIFIEKIDSCENKEINHIFKKMKPYSNYIEIYLHGSYADNTKTPFSDIDDFIVLDFEKLQKDKLLLKVVRLLNYIDMKFCRIDPIQHHGHWISSKTEIVNYDNSFIPLHILKDSKCVIGRNFLEGSINPIVTKDGFKRNIINTCKEIERLVELYFNNSINAYQLKGLVGSFALMPALVYQIMGDNYSKPEAIMLSNKIFSKKAQSCIEWSTANRANWHIITGHAKFKVFGLLPYLCFDPHLWRIFSSKFSPRVSIVQKNNLSKVHLSQNFVKDFLSESLSYAK